MTNDSIYESYKRQLVAADPQLKPHEVIRQAAILAQNDPAYVHPKEQAPVSDPKLEAEKRRRIALAQEAGDKRPSHEILRWTIIDMEREGWRF